MNVQKKLMVVSNFATTLMEAFSVIVDQDLYYIMMESTVQVCVSIDA